MDIPDDLNLFINRPIEIVREIEPGIVIQNEPELVIQIEPERADLDNNPEIENAYNDVVNMDNLRLQNVRAPRFDAKKSNVLP